MTKVIKSTLATLAGGVLLLSSVAFADNSFDHTYQVGGETRTITLSYTHQEVKDRWTTCPLLGKTAW